MAVRHPITGDKAMKTMDVHKNQESDQPAQELNRPFITPEVNIYETKDGYFLEAEMPGVNKTGLELTLEGNTLTLVGHRHIPPATGRAVQSESKAMDFRRVFELDPAIDTTRINARVEQGLLTVELLKAEAVKPRKVKVE
jgi:HSP20 family protein